MINLIVTQLSKVLNLNNLFHKRQWTAFFLLLPFLALNSLMAFETSMISQANSYDIGQRQGMTQRDQNPEILFGFSEKARVGGPIRPIIPDYIYGNAKFVDPINGSDTNNGSVNSPFKTITHALSTITTASASNRFSIFLFPGTTVEPAAINWKSFVNILGFGKDACILNQDIHFTAASGEVSSMDFIDISVFNGGANQFNFNTSAGLNVNVRVVGCRCSATWNGGGVYGIDNANNLFFEANTQVFDLTVIDGAVHFYSDEGLFDALTINNGLSPFVEFIGGNLQGTVSLNGNAQLISRGVLNSADITGTTVSGISPTWITDSSSMTSGAVSNTKINQVDDLLLTTSTDFTLTKETIVLADASANAITVTLPSADAYTGRRIEIKKIDDSSNIVTIQPVNSQTIDGSLSAQLISQNQVFEIISDGSNWFVMSSSIF